MRSLFGLLCLLFIGIVYLSVTAEGQYNIGLGIYDITGPAAEVNMMGMGKSGQRTKGIHQRLRSRAFIIEDQATSKRVVYVTNNICMTYGGMMLNITNQLAQKYGNLYTYENVMVSGEHTHSGPAGYTYMSLYDITSLGFHYDNFMTIVDGIVAAIEMAHNNMTTGNVYINNGTLLDTNANRSPYSYTFNPASEQAEYPYNVDKNMTVLKFVSSAGKELGLLSWFSVHGTSMNNTNELISGDNKGYAAYYTEKQKNGLSSIPGMGPFIAGFAQSNEGDVTPNTLGAFCPDGSPCDPRASTCPGPDGVPRVEGCRGIGPGETMFDATKIIGQSQADYALYLYDNAVTQLQGEIAYIHTWLNMSNIQVSPQYTSTGQPGNTCPAALGDSFAGGTTDGAGDFNFVQGTNDTETNKYWNKFAYTFLSNPTSEQIACQAPKPILLNVGEINFPAPWAATIVPIQIFKIGQLYVLGVPGEFTTMSGRRLRDSIRTSLTSYGLADANTHIVISGLSNEYTHYITTYQEYQVQRYEGASTLYGPHTLAAYQQEFDALVAGLAQNQTSLPGPTPPDLSYVQWCLAECDRLPDGIPSGVSFGQVKDDALPSYALGDTVSVTFYGSNPDHDFLTQSSYLTVDQQVGTGWQTILYDGDWDTKLHWKREGLDQSLLTVEWDIDGSYITPGNYRITLQAYYKELIGRTKHYSGVSSTFSVTSN